MAMVTGEHVPPGAPLNEPAPVFELPDQHGAPTSLGTLCSQGPVAVVFFPFAFTSICTSELAELEAALPELSAQVVAISCDSMYVLRTFADAEKLTFPLLSDFWPHGATAHEYGVFDTSRGCAVRGTFLVDQADVVRWKVVDAIPSRRSLDDLRMALNAL